MRPLSSKKVETHFDSFRQKNSKPLTLQLLDETTAKDVSSKFIHLLNLCINKNPKHQFSSRDI